MTSGTSEDREMQDIQQDVLSEDDRSEQPAVGTSNAMSEGNMQIDDGERAGVGLNQTLLLHPRSASTPISEREAPIALLSPFTIEGQTPDSASLYPRSAPPVNNRSGDFSPKKVVGFDSASQSHTIRNNMQDRYYLIPPSQSSLYRASSTNAMASTGDYLTPSSKHKTEDFADIISPIEAGTGCELADNFQTRRNAIPSSSFNQPSNTPTRKRNLDESNYLTGPVPAHIGETSWESAQARRNALVNSMVSETGNILGSASRRADLAGESSDSPQSRREALVRKMIYQQDSTPTSASKQKTRAFDDPPDPNRPIPSPANKLALEKALENLAKSKQSKKGLPPGFTLKNNDKSNNRSSDEDLFVDQKKSYSPLSEAANSDNEQSSKLINAFFTQESDGEKEDDGTATKVAKSQPAGAIEQDITATASSLSIPEPRSVLAKHMMSNTFFAYKSAVGSKRKSFNYCNTVLKFFAQARAAKVLQQIKEDDILVASIPGYDDHYIPRGDVEAFGELLEEIASLAIWGTGGATVEVSVELAH